MLYGFFAGSQNPSQRLKIFGQRRAGDGEQFTLQIRLGFEVMRISVESISRTALSRISVGALTTGLIFEKGSTALNTDSGRCSNSTPYSARDTATRLT
jgi:hypothetical protein